MPMLGWGRGAGLRRRCRDKATMPSVLQSLGFVWEYSGSVEKLQRPRAWHSVIQDWRTWCQQRFGPNGQRHPATLCVCACVCVVDVCVVLTPGRLLPKGSLREAHPGLCRVRVGSSPASTGPLVREQGRASTHCTVQPKMKGLGQNEGQVQGPLLRRKPILSGCWGTSGEGDMRVGKHGGGLVSQQRKGGPRP